MDALAGISVTREVTVTTNGAPDTAATLTYTLVNPSGSTVISAQAATHIGSGVYQYAVDGSTYLANPGVYRETWSGSTGSTDLRFDGQFLVGYWSAGMQTRRELRHHIARRLNDLWTGVSTGSNSTTTIKDTDRVEPDNHWRGGTVYIYGGTGRATLDTHERYVSSSTQTGGVITVGKAWAGTTPDTTSLYELHRRFTVADYNAAINMAIVQLGDDGYHIPITDESVTLTTNTYEYTIPAGITVLSAVWWRDTSSSANDWYSLKPQNTALARGDYCVIPGRRILRVPRATTNYRLRLVGGMQPPPLTRDDSLSDVAPTWLIYQAAALLLAGHIRGPQLDRDATAQHAQMYFNLAQQVRPIPRANVNAIRL